MSERFLSPLPGPTPLPLQRPAEEPLRGGWVEPYDGELAVEGDSQTLLRCWELFGRRRGMLLLFAALGVVVGVLLSLPQTPMYRAEAKLEIQGGGDNLSTLGEINAAQGGRYLSESEIATQVEMLESRVLLGKVIAKLGLEKRPEFTAPQGRLALWREVAGWAPADGPTARERALEAALERLDVESSRRSRIVTLTAEWPDAELAAQFVNTLAETYIEHNLETRWEATQKTGIWLTRQLEQLRGKLEAASEKLQSYAAASGLLYTSETENVAEAKLRQVQAELSSAQAARIARQSSFELAKSSPPESLPEVLDNLALRGYQQQLTDLLRQGAELAATYTPEHSKVKRIQAQAAEIEGAIERERAHAIRRIHNEYETALRRENLLRADYQRQSAFVSEQGRKAIQYNILKGEVATTRQLYDSLLQKVKEAGVASAISASNVRLVDPAQPPRRAHRPRHAVNAAIGLLLGLFGGVLFVLVGEQVDRTIKQPGDSMLYMSLPELGIIPSLHRAEGGGRGAARRKQLAAASAPKIAAAASGADCNGMVSGGTGSRGTGLSNAGSGGAESNSAGSRGAGFGRMGAGAAGAALELVAWRDKPSLCAESFRATLTSILFAGGRGQRPRVLVVTSPNPGEGKTTVISNLAVSLAEINRRVLLIDADLRRPRVHQVFGMANTFGLSDLLAARDPIDQIPLKASTLESGVPGLYVLPSGSRTHTISSLLHSPRMGELLERALRVFDTVLIDTPPVKQIADARVLGRISDGVVLVLRAGQTTRGTAKAAADRFADDGIRVLGTVLNAWDPASNGSGYYDGYSYDDSYYDDERAEAGQGSV
jgi:capsular exopolysaccharide synthesis family protein